MKRLELSKNSRLEQVLSFPESRQILEECLPHMAAMLEQNQAVSGFTLNRIAEYAKGAITKEQLNLLDTRLQACNLMVEDSLAGYYSEDQPLTASAAEISSPVTQHSIRPGQVWRDTEGKRIQAHGGAVFYENGTYYWYGENKDRTDGKNAIWTWGIRAYASKDLYNWEDLGLIIPPDLKNRESGLYPEKHADRPHIVKCEKTGQYVCWIKQSGDQGCFLILTADAFTGPYTIVRSEYRPFGMEVGDFDIEVDEKTKKAYLFMDGDHTGIIGMVLTEDYLAVERQVSRQYMGLKAPFCREGVTLFSREGNHFLLTSGMTGYVPNRSDSAVTKDWEEPFVSLGDPHVNDESRASFNSQLSDIFRVEGTDLFISIADRWVPDYPVDAKRADLLERGIASSTDPEHYSVSAEERGELSNSPMLENADTSKATYVWLPVSFKEGKPVIRWYGEWQIEDFLLP